MYRSKLTFSAFLSLFVIFSFSSIGQNITGDLFVCKGSTEVYTMPNVSGTSQTWEIVPANAGTILSQTVTTATIEWGNTSGQYAILYTDGASSNTYPVVIEHTLNLACDKAVTVSMDQSCYVDITPDLILQDMQFDAGSYSISLKHQATGEYLHSTTLDGRHVGELLEVTVIQNCSQNNCWGLLVAEDKNIPELHTSSYLIDCLADYTPHGMNAFPMSGAMNWINERTYTVSEYNYCAEMMLSYEDVHADSDCHGEYADIIHRHWTLVPHGGHVTKGTDTIYMKKAKMSDMVFPKDWDGNQSLNCHLAGSDQGWAMLESGYPSPAYTGRPIGPACGNVQINHYDTKFESCNSSSYKLLRRWELVDWCSGDVVEHNQYIHVQDQKKPECIIEEYIDVTAEWNDCYATFKVPAPEVDDCSDVHIKAGYKYASEGGSPYEGYHTAGVSVMDESGWFTMSNIEVTTEELWIVYIATDECDNSSHAYTTIHLYDKLAPIAICDDQTTIGLGEYGYAWSDYRAFDDGSWDNCGVDSLLVRKLDGSLCETNRDWAERVKFCCEDLDKILTVELKVKDKHGNANVCTTKVTLQDNEPPAIVYCPADTIVNCDLNLSDLGQFGTPEFKDFCAFTTTDSTRFQLNECGVGTIHRLFSASDDHKNTTVCTQLITVKSTISTDSIESNIIWPEDLDIDACENVSVDPDDLDEEFSRPLLKGFTCAVPAINYEDTKFYANDDGSCIKILREWTILEWCQFDPTTTFNGVFSHTQVIKLRDTEKPVITRGCADVTITDAIPDDNCLYRIPLLLAEGTDNGCLDVNLNWRYTIDFNDDGTADIIEPSHQIIDEIWELGTHKVTWFVSDHCGNVDGCSQRITVVDNLAPTPYCITSVSVTLDDQLSEASIWANDFDLKSEDNCSTDSLTFSFSNEEYQPSLTLTCEDLNNLSLHLIDVDIFISDELGNTATCKSTINLHTNQESCKTSADGSGMIYGNVKAWTDDLLPDVMVSASSSIGQTVSEYMTEANGEFQLEELAMSDEFVISASKSDNPLSGLSSVDLVRIQQHILGIKLFESPYQIIAADVNKSNNVSAVDILQLRQLILGLEKSESHSWQFIPEEFVFADDYHPFPFTNDIYIPEFHQSVMHKNIIGIKMGDVNGSYASSSLRTVEKSQLIFARGEGSIKFKTAEETALHGIQLSLEIEGDHPDVAIVSNYIRNEDEYAILQDDGNTIVNISWVSAEMVQLLNNTLLLELTGLPVDVKVSLSQQSLRSEIYKSISEIEFNEYDLELIEETNNEHVFQIYQNEPNPFSRSTAIPIHLTKESEMVLTIYNMNGLLIRQKKKYFPSGKSTWNIHADELPNEGNYLYQISNDDHVIVKKMIMIR